jgi:glycosyltransferase involved in cell wall biosynthesis
MKILWSLPVRGERLGSSRGDMVRAKKLVEALRGVGHEVHVVEFGASSAVSAYRKILRGVLPRLPALMLRDAGRWAASFGQGRQVARAAMDFRADAIVETQIGFCFSGAIAARKTGIPLILDDCSPLREEKALGTGLFGLARDAMLRQTEAAAVVFVSSSSIASSLAQEGMPREKIRLLPNGANLKAYAEVDREETRQRTALEGTCVIGFAGSFQHWHAIHLLVAALDKLRDNDSWHLLLVGEGPALAPALHAARALGLGARVTATGAVSSDRMPELICCFDIGVLPGSNDYGQPMKLVEYAAAGVASVAPDLPPVREIIRDLRTGLLFSPGDALELAGKLKMLIDDAGLRRRMGSQARCSLSEAHDWEARAHVLSETIAPLLAERCPARLSRGRHAEAKALLSGGRSVI